MDRITPIVMPKWGLSMTEGKVIEWLVNEGAEITAGMPIVEVESDKIANVMEATDPGILRRKTAGEGDVLPIKSLLGVMASNNVSDAEIDAYLSTWTNPAADEDGSDSASPYEFIEVDGLRVRYVKQGVKQGTPVLLVHGFGGDLDNWLFNIDAIARSALVIALDLPGHGQSSVGLPGLSITAHAQFLVHLMDELEVDCAHLVGHSMGGAIASQLSLEVPDRVASLTLISSAGLGDDINTAYTEGFASASSRRELKSVLEMLFVNSSLISRRMVDDVLKYKRLDGVDALLTKLGAALFSGGKQSEQPGLKLDGSVPTLVIWGREDRVISCVHAANAPTSAEVAIVDGAGHMVQMERANEVNKLILEHIGEQTNSVAPGFSPNQLCGWLE